MISLLDKYKGGILFILVFVFMFNLYSNRIKELNQLEQTNIAFYEE